LPKIAKIENRKPLKRKGTADPRPDFLAVCSAIVLRVRIGFPITRDHGDGGDYGDLLS